jgi:NADH:quinone reductase (non-electrogenic)
LQTRLTDLLHITYPIVQGGLAYLAYAELAAAVSNAGGLGQITATSLPTGKDLEKEIRKFRVLSNRPFGVNIAISLHRSIDEFIDVVISEQVPVVTLTGGNPAPVLERLANTGVKKLVLVSSVRQAKKAEVLGADAVIAVGQEGGGHIGRDDTGTMVLVPLVAESVHIPVVASGGIADGRGLLAALSLGAEGIEMGTRFIATKECIAHKAYKERLVRGSELDTVVIKRSLGTPGRVIGSPYANHVLTSEHAGADQKELYSMLTGERNQKAAYDGDFDQGFAWAGQSIGFIHSVPTVADLINEIVQTASRYQEKINKMLD